MKKQTKRWAWAGGAFVVGLALAASVSLVSKIPRNYKMSSGHMEPSLPVGTLVWVRHLAYASVSEVRRGDVIVFTRNDETTGLPTDFVTRVVALPGDKVQMAGTTLKINGRALPHKKNSQSGKIVIYQEINGADKYQVQYGAAPEPGAPYGGVVPAGKLFCLGDNRGNSYDSRFTGAVPFEDVQGKQVF